MKFKIYIMILLCFSNIHSQEKIKKSKYIYEFTIYDGSESSTMHQFSKNYLSAYRIFSRTILYRIMKLTFRNLTMNIAY